MPPYRGRFAPSPTGPLHFGSLVTALASWLEARSRQGVWLVRIEDLDPLREPPGAADSILQALERHALHHDESLRFQSRRSDAYQAVLERLREAGQIYPCRCSRKELASANNQHPKGCRQQPDWNSPQAHALRFALTTRQWQWHDQLLGAQTAGRTAEYDDFVVKRKEGFFAYQLAVVCDDIDQGITHIVRGSDLLDATPDQLALYQAMNAEPPVWQHLPVILNAQGQKLSKQNLAPALNIQTPGLNLSRALQHLGQQPPPTLERDRPENILLWAQENWHPVRIPPQQSIPENPPA